MLRDLGHDVVTAVAASGSTTSDEGLLSLANEETRIFVTRDRDFGGLVFLRRLAVGVIYLRMLPSTQQAVHRELQSVLAAYAEDELRQAFVVVEPGRHRFRKLLP